MHIESWMYTCGDVIQFPGEGLLGFTPSTDPHVQSGWGGIRCGTRWRRRTYKSVYVNAISLTRWRPFVNLILSLSNDQTIGQRVVEKSFKTGRLRLTKLPKCSSFLSVFLELHFFTFHTLCAHLQTDNTTQIYPAILPSPLSSSILP